MKKYFVPFSVSLLIGVSLAYFIIHQYESLDGITVSALASEIYYVQRGVYSDRENMEINMKDFTNYIYNVEDNMYHTYIGVSKYKENAEKIQNIYKNEGIETIIKKDRDLSQISYWNQIESIPNAIPCPYQNCNSYSILKENLNHESDKKSNIDEHSSINYKNINTSIHDFDIILEEKPIILECQNKHKF